MSYGYRVEYIIPADQMSRGTVTVLEPVEYVRTMRFRFGVTAFGFWKITCIARDAKDFPPVVLQYLLDLDGKTLGGAGKIFATVQ